jgi:histone-lysine N-methyltransferase SETD2
MVVLRVFLQGNHARFINHSCEPNCETQKWMVRGELAIGLYTLRKIKAGEQQSAWYIESSSSSRVVSNLLMSGQCIGCCQAYSGRQA